MELRKIISNIPKRGIIMKNRCLTLAIILTTIACSHSLMAQTYFKTISWSPDGKQLLIAKEEWKNNRSNFTQLVMEGDGTLIRTINDAWGASWSADGQQIIYSKNGGLFICNKNGTIHKNIISGPSKNMEPSFSPDGRKISFTAVQNKDHDIYVSDVSGNNLKKIASGGYTSSWSPKVEYLVYYKDKGDNMDKIYTYSIADGTEHLVTQDSLHNFYPSWTFDGKILYTSTPSSRKEPTGLYIIDQNGNDKRKIGSIVPWIASMSPDGRRIAFVENEIEGSKVFISDNQGENKRCIAR